MDEVIWVEILSRHRDVAARHRCAGSTVRIGRAYDNDVVIDDPHVAPHHLRIVRDAAGQLVAEDLGSLNGLLAVRSGVRRDRIVLDGDQVIRIGHTELRARGAEHPVGPERPTAAATRRWPLLAGLAAATLATSALSAWLTEIAEPKLSRYLLPLLVLPVVALAWAAGWAVLSRIFDGRARFERNLLVALSGILAYWVGENLLAVLGFALAWRGLATVHSIGTWCLLGAVVFLHLRVIGPAWLWPKAAAAAGLTAIVIALQLIGSADGGGLDQRGMLANFMPPTLRLTALRDETAFFGDLERLKRRIDRDRTEESPFASLQSLTESDD